MCEVGSVAPQLQARRKRRDVRNAGTNFLAQGRDCVGRKTLSIGTVEVRQRGFEVLFHILADWIRVIDVLNDRDKRFDHIGSWPSVEVLVKQLMRFDCIEFDEFRGFHGYLHHVG